MSELERQLRSDPASLERTAASDSQREADADRPADEPTEDGDYTVPVADVGDAQRGQGTDGMGGYGNRAIPQEGGPNQDH